MMERFLASDADLLLAEVDSMSHSRRVSRHMVFAGCLLILGVLLGLMTRSPLTGLGIVVSFSLLASLVVTLPRRRIQQQAQSHRRQLEMATAVFLDLVNVLLAGGAGIETSVIAASSVGDGPGFSLIRLAIMRAQSSRKSYWESLIEVGTLVNVPSLVEVAHTVQLAGEHGARIRTSLSTKAKALRQRNLAQVEFDEEQRTEKIGLPLVVLFLGFLILIGYPAFTQTVSSF